jgi:hypothetical protein
MNDWNQDLSKKEIKKHLERIFFEYKEFERS